MFTVKNTKQNLGVEISGGYEDLNVLYDALSRLCSIDVNLYEGVQSRLFAFLYELRNTFEGEREIYLNTRELSGLKKKSPSESKLVYEVIYMNRFLWTEILFIVFALEDYKTMCLTDEKHFIIADKNLQAFYASCKRQCIKDIAIISYFQECVWEALNEGIGEIRTKSLRKLLKNHEMNYKGYCTQAIDFMNIRLVQVFVENRAKVIGELARNMIKKDAGYEELAASIHQFAKQQGIAYHEVDFEGNEIDAYESLSW